MFKRITLVVFILLFMSVLFTGSPIMAEKSEKKQLWTAPVTTFYPPTPKEAQAMAKQLKLTPEQQPQMKEINERYHRDLANLRNEYNEAYREVVFLINEPRPDPNHVNQRLIHFHKVHEKILEKEIQYWMDLKKILTPEQNNILWNIFEKNRIKR